MKTVEYSELKRSEKFTPALYQEKDGIWEGGGVSHFTPVMIFRLWEKFSDACWRGIRKHGSEWKEPSDMMNRLFIKGYKVISSGTGQPVPDWNYLFALSASITD